VETTQVQVVGVGLHRVRRPADIGEISQEPVDRDDRDVEGHREQIRRPAILSGLRQLSLWLGPRRNYPPASSPARSRITRLRGQLAAAPR
jgi:hypothetical protein